MTYAWREYLTLTFGYVFILLIIFFIINIIHFRLFHPQIVLHAVALDTILAVIITGGLLKIVPAFSFHSVLLANACLIFFLLTGLYNVLGPTMCDRSLSVFLLMQIKQADNSGKIITVNNLIKKTDSEYIRGSHMVEKRLIEHQASGAIEINKDGMIKLTLSGELAVNTFEFLYWSLDIPQNF